MRSGTVLGRLGVVVLLSLGYLVLHDFVLVLLVSAAPPSDAQSNYEQRQQVAIVNGQPVFWHPSMNAREFDFHTLDGKAVKVAEKEQLLYGASMWKNPSVSSSMGDWGVLSVGVNQNPSEPWFFVQERSRKDVTAYFVAYANATRRPIVYLGARGPSAIRPAPAEQFSLAQGAWNVVSDEGYLLGSYWRLRHGLATNGRFSLLTKAGLYHVDLPGRKVTQLLDGQGMENLTTVEIREFQSGYLGTVLAKKYAVRSADTVVVIEQGKVVSKYLIPDSLRNGAFTIYPVDRNTAYYSTTLNDPLAQSAYPRNLMKCDASGGLVQSWEINQPANQANSSLPMDYLLGAALLPMPLHMVVSLFTSLPSNRLSPTELAQTVWLSFAVASLCGILAVVGAWRLAPRFGGTSMHWGWMPYVFLFGLPGMVGYLLHFRTRQRPRLLPESRLGTEIFA